MENDNMHFPIYARRMIVWSCVLTAAGGAVLFPWGVSYWGAWVLGASFNIWFFIMMSLYYSRWSRQGRDVIYIGQHIALYGILRMPAEAVLCVLVLMYPFFNILAFAGGLLSLRISIYADAIRGVIKK